METQTNPATGVEQDASPMDRVMSILNRDQDDAPPAETQEEAAPAAEVAQQQPEDQATDEVTPDDIPDDPAPQSTVEAFEITHNGQKRSLTRDEAIQYAQQGLDYTQKTQALAEQSRQVQAWLKQSQEIEQVQVQLADDLAIVKALEAQLNQIQNIDWMKLATDDPLEFPKYQARHQALTQAYQKARGQYEQKAHAVTEQRKLITAQIVQRELPKLLERIPEWREPAKFQAGSQRLRAYLIDQGASPERIDALADSLEIHIAEKARKYDELVKAKADKVKQLRTVPPVSKPGASRGPAATADKDRELRQRLGKTKTTEDAVAVILNRMK